MSANRKAPTTTAGGDHGTNTQEHMNVLYAAHQVHTLAQIVLQQITGNRSGQAPWTMPAGVPGGPYPGAGNGMSPHAPGTSYPAMPPALFYWYP